MIDEQEVAAQLMVNALEHTYEALEKPVEKVDDVIKETA